MKKLLQINTVVNTGSTGRIAEGIGRTFQQNGWDSYIAYGRKDRPSDLAKIKIGNDWDILLHGLKSYLLDKHGFGSVNPTKELVSHIKDIKPDLIGLHNLHGYYLNIKILFEFLKSTNIPVVWTLFDCWSFTGHCTYFDTAGCYKWQSHCKQCPLTHQYPKSIWIDNSQSNFANKRSVFKGHQDLTIVTHSHWLKNQVKKSFLQDYPVKVIHNGVDLEIFKVLPGRVNHSDTKVILGVANTWSERKGLRDFLMLRNKLSSAYEIVLIGLSKKQIDALPEGIRGISRTEDQHALTSWYNNADVFINPTYDDNFPTTNIEALACGTPVITYDTGGSPEAVDEQTGRVVGKGDIDGLINAITELERMDQGILSNNCRKRAIDHFDKNERYEDYVKLYEEISQLSI